MDGFNHFPEIAAALSPGLGTIVRRTSTSVQRNIKQQIVANGQIRTGYMYDSVGVLDIDDFGSDVVCGASYGIYQNYGTRYIPARPFMEPGTEATRGEWEDALSNLEGLLGG